MQTEDVEISFLPDQKDLSDGFEHRAEISRITTALSKDGVTFRKRSSPPPAAFRSAMLHRSLSPVPGVGSIFASGTMEQVVRFAVGAGHDAIPVLAAALGAWIQSRLGRRVKIKVGDVEAEASSPEKVHELLERAFEVRHRLSDTDRNEK